MSNGDPTPGPAANPSPNPAPSPDPASKAGADSSGFDDIPESSGGTSMGKPGIFALSIYLIGITFFVVYGLIAFWPTQDGKNDCSTTPRTSQTTPQTSQTTPQTSQTTPQTSQTTSQTSQTTSQTTNTQSSSASQSKPVCYHIQYFSWERNIPSERSLFLIVLFAGALGGLVHALRSLYWYVGNRRMVWSWSLMYLLMPFLGATMALVFALVIRGGFFSPGATIDDTSPFGFAAWSALVGMFTREAAEKLKQTFEALLTKAEKGKDHVAAAPTISKIDPPSGKVGDQVTITGSGFVSESVVNFGGQLIQKPQVSKDGTTLTVTAPAHAAGQVAVEVINPGDQKAKGSFTYTP